MEFFLKRKNKLKSYLNYSEKWQTSIIWKMVWFYILCYSQNVLPVLAKDINNFLAHLMRIALYLINPIFVNTGHDNWLLLTYNTHVAKHLTTLQIFIIVQSIVRLPMRKICTACFRIICHKDPKQVYCQFWTGRHACDQHSWQLLTNTFYFWSK